MAMGRHDQQLQTFRTGKFLQTTAHSLLGAVDVYNLLPQYVIAACDVSTFQNRLQQLLKAAAREKMQGWTTFLSNRHLIFRHPLHQLGGFEGPAGKVRCMGIGGANGDMYNCTDQWLAFGQSKNE